MLLSRMGKNSGNGGQPISSFRQADFLELEDIRTNTARWRCIRRPRRASALPRDHACHGTRRDEDLVIAIVEYDELPSGLMSSARAAVVGNYQRRMKGENGNHTFHRYARMNSQGPVRSAIRANPCHPWSKPPSHSQPRISRMGTNEEPWRISKDYSCDPLAGWTGCPPHPAFRMNAVLRRSRPGRRR